jgi:hypothetical protein
LEPIREKLAEKNIYTQKIYHRQIRRRKIMNTSFRILKLGIILIMMLGNMLFITVGLPDEAEAFLPPLAEIRWNEGQDVQEAEVKPGEHGTVIFTGVVNCEMVAGGTFQKVIVSLQASSDQGWTPVVNPPQITFNPNSDSNLPFSVTVTVPAETSFYTTDTIRVSGRGVAYPGATQDIIDEVTATIKVAQFYKFSLECSKAYQEVGPSERLAFDLRVKNHGNARDTFNIKISNLKELTKDGWTVTLSTDVIEINEKDEGVVQIPVGTPIKFNLWLNEIETVLVEVKSEQEEKNEGFTVPREYPLSVRQRGFSTPGFDPFFLLIGIAGLAVIVKTRNNTIPRKRRRRRK